MTVRTLARTTEKPKTAEKRKQLQAVTRHLVCAGAADAIEFYTKAFGAVETMRLPGKDGRLMHAAGPASANAELAATKRTVHRVRHQISWPPRPSARAVERNYPARKLVGDVSR